MSQTFDQLFTRHAMASYAKQLRLADITGEAAWDVDLDQGTLGFGDMTFQAGLLGSYGKGAGTWLWSWANKSMSNLPERVTAVAGRMKETGIARDIPELREAEIAATEDFCHRLAMVAVGEAGAGAYYRGPYESGAAYLVIHDPLPPAQDGHRLARIQRVIAESISTFTLNHRRAVESYFETESLPVQHTDASEILVSAEDGELRIRFDGEGTITEMKGLLHPTKPKGGFLRRLFGKDKT